MDGDADILSRHPFARYRLTRADYRRMGEAGILGEDDRVELLEGQLVAMPGIGPRHALCVDALIELLVPAVAGRASVRAQNPVALDNESEPQPDLVLARKPWRGYPQDHPGPEDILLLIEAADSTREFDLGAKRALYARAGIREFWVVDLTRDVVVVCRAPEGEHYRTVREIGPSGVVEIAALPDVTILAQALFT